MALEQVPSPDWLPPSFLHPQPIPAQAASCKERQKWPYLFLTGAVCPRDLPHGRRGWNWEVGGERALFSGNCMPSQWWGCPVQAPRGGVGMGEILALEGFKGQQVVTVFFSVPPHPLLQLVFLCGLSSQLERLELYRPQIWRWKGSLVSGASSAGFLSRYELKGFLQPSLVIQVLQVWGCVLPLLRPWMLQESDICFSRGTQAGSACLCVSTGGILFTLPN